MKEIGQFLINVAMPMPTPKRIGSYALLGYGGEGSLMTHMYVDKKTGKVTAYQGKANAMATPGSIGSMQWSKVAEGTSVEELSKQLGLESIQYNPYTTVEKVNQE